MAQIPLSASTKPLQGLTLVRRGKVRDTYELPDHPDLLLVFTSDRLSIYDFILPTLVPLKGQVLTAINIFWRLLLSEQGIPHDLVAFGTDIDDFLPEPLRGNPDLHARATVVRKLRMLPFEAIVRGNLTGSGFASYTKTGMVCGHALKPGLRDGDLLPEEPIFTPTTKAEDEHDAHIPIAEFRDQFGTEAEALALRLFKVISSHAAAHGIILADSKFEFGTDETGALVVGDEIATPDSSRYWDHVAWNLSRAAQTVKPPPSYDKDSARRWGRGIGVDKRDPGNPDDVDWVHAQQVPDELLRCMKAIYRSACWRITGQRLEDFQREVMGINIRPQQRHVVVVTGSESDDPHISGGLGILREARDRGEIDADRHVISCHRNPNELTEFAELLASSEDDLVVIAGAGLAAALPGILKAMLVSNGRPDIPVIGVALPGGSAKANEGARSSIELVPGGSVILRPNGEAHFGSFGFEEACRRAVSEDFPANMSERKPAKLNLPI